MKSFLNVTLEEQASGIKGILTKEDLLPSQRRLLSHAAKTLNSLLEIKEQLLAMMNSKDCFEEDDSIEAAAEKLTEILVHK